MGASLLSSSPFVSRVHRNLTFTIPLKTSSDIYNVGRKRGGEGLLLIVASSRDVRVTQVKLRIWSFFFLLCLLTETFLTLWTLCALEFFFLFLILEASACRYLYYTSVCRPLFRIKGFQEVYFLD